MIDLPIIGAQTRECAQTASIQQQSLADIMSDFEIAKSDLHAQLEIQNEAARTTSAMLCAATDSAIQVDNEMQMLDVKIAEVRSELAVGNRARCKVEQLLWVEQQRVKALGGSLEESKRASEDVMHECNGLSGMVRQLWDEKAALEGQVVLMPSLCMDLTVLWHSNLAFTILFLHL
jgi:hypothetical protein